MHFYKYQKETDQHLCPEFFIGVFLFCHEKGLHELLEHKDFLSGYST